MTHDLTHCWQHPDIQAVSWMDVMSEDGAPMAVGVCADCAPIRRSLPVSNGHVEGHCPECGQLILLDDAGIITRHNVPNAFAGSEQTVAKGQVHRPRKCSGHGKPPRAE